MNTPTLQASIAPVVWVVVGLTAMACASILLMTTYALTPICPMPVHLYVGYWTIGQSALYIIPFIYVIHVGLVFADLVSEIYFRVISICLFLLNAIYLLSSVNAGLKWQGEIHVAAVIFENAVGFGLIYWLLMSDYTKAKPWRIYAANFILFFMLVWCMFPTLGEVA